MMKNLRILFMGTPDFAVYILDHLLKNNYLIAGVVTAPDKPAGRGQKIYHSAVKKYALAHGLPVLQPKNLKSEAFQKDVRILNPDLSVVVAFRMLPKEVWDFPRYGTFNLHASLLPQYRGAAPINWAIINGESKTGVTTFFLDDKIDTGAIIKQEEVAISPDDDAGSLHDKLMIKGAELVDQTLQLIINKQFETTEQPQTDSLKPAPKLNKENTKIDWAADPEDICNLVRGLNPYPVAWSYFINEGKQLTCKIFKVRYEKSVHPYPAGKLIKTKNSLKTAVKEGYISILEMQLPSKRKMPVEALLNGLRLSENARMQ